MHHWILAASSLIWYVIYVIRYTLCSMKCIVAYYYQDYHESQRKAKRIMIKIYRGLRSTLTSFTRRRFTWTLIAIALLQSEGLPRIFCTIIRDCIIGIVGIIGERRGWVGVCFNLPPRWPYPAVHQFTMACRALPGRFA